MGRKIEAAVTAACFILIAGLGLAFFAFRRDHVMAGLLIAAVMALCMMTVWEIDERKKKDMAVQGLRRKIRR